MRIPLLVVPVLLILPSGPTPTAAGDNGAVVARDSSPQAEKGSDRRSGDEDALQRIDEVLQRIRVEQLAQQPTLGILDPLDAAAITWDFERGLEGWIKTGNAFDQQPTFGNNVEARRPGTELDHQGDYWIGTYEARPSPSHPFGAVQGDAPQGTLTSQHFVPGARYLTFRVGGGSLLRGVSVQLRNDDVDGGLIFRAAGDDDEAMHAVVWDLRQVQGTEVYLQIIDASSGDWGHINVDGFEFLDELPSPPERMAEGCPGRNLDFENGLECWKLEGGFREGGREYNAFLGNPVVLGTAGPRISGISGRAYVHSGTSSPENPGRGRGHLVSASFPVERRYITFLVGGDSSEDLRVELIVRSDDGPIAQPDGRYRAVVSTRLPRRAPARTVEAILNASDYIGRTARLRVLDDSTEGFIAVDRFVFLNEVTDNWDFERGLESWTIAYGDAFDQQPTHGDNVLASRARPPGFDLAGISALGGNYWDNLYATGHHAQRWIGTFEDYPDEVVYQGPHAVARGRTKGDHPTGALVSREFTIRDRFISFLIGGSRDARIERGVAGATDEEAIRAALAARLRRTPTLLSDPAVTVGVVLQSREGERWVDRRYATGKGSDIFERVSWDVADLIGRQARIVILDGRADGHVNVDDITFTEQVNVQAYRYGPRQFVRDPTRDEPPPLWGFADAHTHPTSHLAFGGEGRLFWGEPLGSIEDALRPCDGYHLGTVASVEVANRSVPLAVSKKVVQTLERIEDDPEVVAGAVITGVLDLLNMNDPVSIITVARALPVLELALPPVLSEAVIVDRWMDWNSKRSLFNQGVPHVAQGGPSFPRELAATGEPAHRAHGRSLSGGWPNFWTRTHEQMHISWIRRAHQGGLRLLVSHATNAELLAAAVGNPQDVADLLPRQIEYVERMARENADIMEIARSPEDARRIIGEGRIAVVHGLEMVTIDRLLDPSSPDRFADLAERLFGMGIRHVYPIHNTNNSFGGTALYENLFNLNNLYLTGSFWRVESGTRHGIPEGRRFFPAGVTSSLQMDIGVARLDLWPYVVQLSPLLGTARLGNWTVDLSALARELDRASREYGSIGGHVNADGLTPDGERFVLELMRKGMVIDIDHSSIKARAALFDLAERFCRLGECYPLTSSHSDFNSLHDQPYEAQLLDAELERFGRNGGMVNPIFKVGADVTRGRTGNCLESSTSWLAGYRYAVGKMGRRGVGFGSDFDGFLGAPRPRFGKNFCDYAAGSDVDYNLAVNEITRRNGVRYAHYPNGVDEIPSPDAGRHSVQSGNVLTDLIPLASDQPPLRALGTGTRVFDVNVDGAVHIGMLPDFFQDAYNQVETSAVSQPRSLFQPLFESAESYIRMWERAERLAAP